MSTAKAAVFPGAFHAIMTVAAADVVSDPAVVRVHMRSVRMPVMVAIAAILLCLAGSAATGAGTMFRDVLATVVMTIAIAVINAFVPLLSTNWNSDKQHQARENQARESQ